ncbi:MAG: beta-galactosidase, partial [Planctomycetes bacterium]|nr:beta-galactosidase [Planctomycetota bacterium]
YASFKPLKTDKFGGLPDSGAKLGLKKTGFFHVEKKGDKWFLADPEGNAFFHLGVCSFSFTEDYTYVEGREDIYEWLPPHDEQFKGAWHWENYWNPRAVSFYAANLIRKYGKLDMDEWTARMIERVKAFGFNSIGAFSGSPVYDKVGFPHVAHLPINCGQVPGLRGVFDPFNPNNLKKLDADFAGLAKSADNPLIIGYFLANEQGWEDLPRAVPALDGKHACKKRLVQMLEAKYKTIDKFNAAWKLAFKNFAEMNDAPLALKSEAAFADMLAYNELFLEAYYKAITDAFRKYDKNHMLIGNRWQPGTANSEVLCKVAGKYMDVISINYYTKAIDSQFIRRLYKWTGEKPQFWSEFYYTCEKECNVAGSGMDVTTQLNRGLAYRNYVEGAAALGFVVGIEWFTLTDQSVTGRFFEKYNGERNNTGLFNVLDRPYKATVEEMAKTNKDVYAVWIDGKKPYVFDNPQFSAASGAKQTAEAGHANGAIVVNAQLDASWPGRPPVRISGARLVSGRDAEGFEADYKVCWDEKNLYLLVNVKDPTPLENHQEGGNLWNGDGVELFFGREKLDQGGALIFSDRQVLLGAGKNGQFHMVNADKQPDIKTAVAKAVDGKGWTLEASIPWEALGVKAPKAGDEFLFDLAIDDGDNKGGRTRQLMWNGVARNSSDRGAWGRLKLAR